MRLTKVGKQQVQGASIHQHTSAHHVQYVMSTAIAVYAAGTPPVIPDRQRLSQGAARRYCRKIQHIHQHFIVCRFHSPAAEGCHVGRIYSKYTVLINFPPWKHYVRHCLCCWT